MMLNNFLFIFRTLNLFKINIDSIVQIVQCALKDFSTELIERVFQQFGGM